MDSQTTTARSFHLLGSAILTNARRLPFLSIRSVTDPTGSNLADGMPFLNSVPVERRTPCVPAVMQGTQQNLERSIRQGFTLKGFPQFAQFFIMSRRYHNLGSGTLILTVGRVAERLGRRWIGLDIGYQDLQLKRLANVQRELAI